MIRNIDVVSKASPVKVSESNLSCDVILELFAAYDFEFNVLFIIDFFLMSLMV